MNHRERFFTTLDLEEPDYVPVTDLKLDPSIVEGVLRRKQDVSLAEFGIDSFGIHGREKAWESNLQYRISMVEACRKLDFDAVVAIHDFSLFTKGYTPEFVDGEKFIDPWGRVMQTNLQTKTTYFVGGIVANPEDLKYYEPPDPFHPDILEMMEKIVKPIKGEDIVVIAHCHTGWHMAFQVRGGIDRLVVDFYRNPGFARKLMDKVSKATQLFAEAMIEAGADVLWVGDDYADSHGPLINPKIFREYEIPYLKSIVEIGKRRGVPVLKHSDGNLNPILDDIVNAGINGLHPIEPGVMDLGEVKARFGDRICLIGNVDCRYILPYGGEEDVRKDVRRCIDAAGEGGGLILTSSNTIHTNVKVENVFTMVDEARKYGKYPLRAL